MVVALTPVAEIPRFSPTLTPIALTPVGWTGLFPFRPPGQFGQIPAIAEFGGCCIETHFRGGAFAFLHADMTHRPSRACIVWSPHPGPVTPQIDY